MSKKTYFISPDLLRELDALRAVLEDNVLSDQEYGSHASMRKFFTLQGFNEAVGLITNLVHGYNDTADEIKDRLTTPGYMGMVIDLDELEED